MTVMPFTQASIFDRATLFLIDLVVTGSRADRAYRKRKRQRPASFALVYAHLTTDVCL